MAISKLQLEELIEQLKEYRGRHTELITVYISAGYDAVAVQKQLEAEKSTAKNIKSTATRKNVMDALDKIIREIKNFPRTPENGMALFAGNVSEVEGQDDLRVWSFEPPMALKIRLYRCDKEFMLEPLEEMMSVTEVFGLIVMDRKEATIGILIGKRIEVLEKLTSGVPSKVRAGGQSSQRFHRITEGLTKEFYKRIAESAKKSFYDLPKLKGILVGGPIPTKDEFLDNEYLPTQLQEKVIGRKDLGNTDESGLSELVEKSRDVLADQEIVYEKKLLEKFFETLGQRPELAFYKEADIRKALQYGAVELLILNKEMDKKLAHELKVLADGISAKVEVVTSETTEGDQFKKLSGMGALLRFQIH